MKHTTGWLAAVALGFLGEVGFAGVVEHSPRPAARPAGLSVPASAQELQGFASWLAAFRPRALAAGISETTYTRAMATVRYTPDVIRRDGNQAEFVQTLWAYLDNAVSETRIANGRNMLAQHRALFEAIEQRFGVEKEVVAAIWGLESSYGSFRGTTPVLSALATLAYDGRRETFFTEQLIAALKIVQAQDVDPARMTGSWAGAMGHTQFIPTSYLAYAVDFTGNGKRDIWSDNPADALASTAAYLARSGWVKGQPWGVEVRLPAGFDYSMSGKSKRLTGAQWAALGVRTPNGSLLPDHGSGAIFLPAGASGPAFLIHSNFNAIARYNSADAYVIAVGHLADRLRGAGPFQTPWPRHDRGLSRTERLELQERLSAKGYDIGNADGIIGPRTATAISLFQQSRGLIADGYASISILNALR